MDKGSLGINEIYKRFNNYNEITTGELYGFYREHEPDLKEGAFRRRIFHLKELNIIEPIKRGVYRLVHNSEYLPGDPASLSGNRYLVFTADVIGSKGGNLSQGILNSKIDALNSHPYESLVTPFGCSRGDEIQVVGLISKELPRIIRHMRYAMLPFKTRIGIGLGMIEGSSISADPWQMSGEAFYNARYSLEQLSDNSDNSVYMNSGNYRFDNSFNIIYRLIDAIVNDWSDKQWEAVQLYDRLKSYDAGADRLSISKSSFYQRCSIAKWNVINEAEIQIGDMLIDEFVG